LLAILNMTSFKYGFLGAAVLATGLLGCHHNADSGTGGTIPPTTDSTGNARATIQQGSAPYNEGTSSGTDPSQSAGPHTPGTGAGTTSSGGPTYQDRGSTGPNTPNAAPSNVGGSRSTESGSGSGSGSAH